MLTIILTELRASSSLHWNLRSADVPEVENSLPRIVEPT